MKYMEIRKEERKDWTRAGQNRGTSQDLKAVSEALSYLQQKGLSTVEDLEAFLESLRAGRRLYFIWMNLKGKFMQREKS